MVRRIICWPQTFGFETTPAPAVQVYCYIERIGYGEMVDFLIDTGASETCLHGIYAFDLQEHMRISTLENYYGIGGISCGYYHEKATLIFQDDKGQPLSRVIRIGIQQFTDKHVSDPGTLEESLECPSLLGRDILNKSLFVYRIKPEEITLTFR